jgi:hypothetical protein
MDIFINLVFESINNNNMYAGKTWRVTYHVMPISTRLKWILGTQFSVRKISWLPNFKYSEGKCCRPVQPISSKCFHIWGITIKQFIHKYTISFLMRLIMEITITWTCEPPTIGVVPFGILNLIWHRPLSLLYLSIMWQINSPSNF